MSEILILTLENPGERLDKALAGAIPDLSRVQCQRLIKDGYVTLDGEVIKGSTRLSGGEQIRVVIPEKRDSSLVPQAIPLDIVYEDSDLVVVDKKAGMVVHPAPGHDSGTLVNAILAHCPDLAGIGDEQRPGIVHRLDKDTSGLIIVAKNDRALHYLQDQFKKRTVTKIYTALVEGTVPNIEILIDAPIGRDPNQRKKMSVIPPGSSAKARQAVTRVTKLRTLANFSLVECRPETGRTHQIRVHLAYAGYPIVGDSVYGRGKQRLLVDRHFLHASEITFNRPSDGETIMLKAPLPPELRRVIDQLDSTTG